MAYEVNCWWHPLLGDDRVSLKRLSRYQVLILPGVDCFSDAQREAVRAFQARGGKVLSVACSTACNADAVPRPSGETLALPGESRIEIDPHLASTYAKAGDKPFAELPPETHEAGREMHKALDRALSGAKLLETDAPRDVWANLWLDDTRRVLALHLVNGGIEVQANRFRMVEDSRWRVRLPAGLEVNRAVLISPDECNERMEAKPLAVDVVDGWATVRVPRLECSAVVALFEGEALAAAEDLAQARRAIWRASLIRGPGDESQSARLEEVLTRLRNGPLEAAIPVVRGLAEDSREALNRLIKDATGARDK